MKKIRVLTAKIMKSINSRTKRAMNSLTLTISSMLPIMFTTTLTCFKATQVLLLNKKLNH